MKAEDGEESRQTDRKCLVRPGGVWTHADNSGVSSDVLMPKANRMTFVYHDNTIKIQLPCIFVLGRLLQCLQSGC